MKRNIHIAMAVLANICFAFAQNDSTVAIREVTVVDTRLQALHIGQYHFKLDSINTLLNTQQLMAGWLHRESAVHIRQYAPGSVATYSTRGATSAQSTVLWGGFSLNDAGTGLVDLSIVPAFLFEPSLLRGGSATLFGSGAVGSVLNLSQNTSKQGFSARLLQQVGSFQTFSTGIELGYQSAKWQTKTAFFSNQSKNNFSYQDPFSVKEKKLIRENAAFHQQHFTQFLGYQINKKQTVDVHVWLSKSHRETPRSILTMPGAATLGDKSLKTTAAWHYSNGKHKLDAAYGYVYAWQNYRDTLLPIPSGETTNDTNLSASQQFRLDYLYKINHAVVWQSGILLRHDNVDGSNRRANQQTGSLQTGLLIKHKKIESQLALRGEVWDSKFLPLSPFISAKYQLNQKFSFSAYGGYNYRIPSMNDRFWIPSGNLGLQPENGITTEVASVFSTQIIQFRLSGYYSLINEYIRWAPSSAAFWIPENAKKVSLSGIDFTAKYFKKFGKVFFTGEAFLSINRSITLASHVANDKSVGQQLTYQPKEKATFNAIVARNGYAFQGSLHHVGSVSTTYGQYSQVIDNYQIMDLSISKYFNLKQVGAMLQLSVNNILNQQFQTIPYFPMPGINYQVTIKIDI
jgi:vitamin B12 transporter